MPVNKQSLADRTRILKEISDAPDEMVLTIQEVAAISGFAPVTIRLWNFQGEGRGPQQIRIEGRPRYRLGEVRRWLKGGHTE